ncbi:MAG: 3'(2'),5'-bisphosphate nucleotidase [Candidatus Dadabacteria bacterium]|nr:3'(2'),5'-bisphosphate nucleotidase [Candidatus Dadabacteria bacterium]MDE0477313.1 3'(2'),5'-bisphosphate nucleotidase [Candidatus Dadabacteria bacterium]
MGFEFEKKVGLEAVTKAAKVCARMSGKPEFREALYKTDGSPVTLADFFVQALINEKLTAAFPETPIVAEETSFCLEGSCGEKLRKNLEKLLPGKSPDEIFRAINRGNYGGGNHGRFWTLDPIDGTRGFLAKRQYAIALALIEAGEVVLGILGCPELGPDARNGTGREKGFVFFAEKGQGSYQAALSNGLQTRISVSGIARTSEAVMCESVEAPDSSYEFSGKISRFLDISAGPVRMDSQCKYAILARGDTSIYLRPPPRKDYKENIWDHAAGYIIVKEAGGTVTDSSGKPLDFSVGKKLLENKGVLATNGAIHEAVLQAVKKTVSERNKLTDQVSRE